MKRSEIEKDISEIIKDIPTNRWMELLANQDIIFQEAEKQWGSSEQLIMLAEECLELALAVLHFRRDKASLKEIAEKIADADIMAGQIEQMYKLRKYIETYRLQKLDRLSKKLGID